MKELETNSSVYKKRRRVEIAKKLGACPICPPNGGENAGIKGKRPKSDKYKSKRKGKI